MRYINTVYYYYNYYYYYYCYYYYYYYYCYYYYYYEGLLALKHFFDQRTGKEPSYETLLRLAELAPALNFFQFGDQYFRGFYRTPIFQSIRLGPEPELYGRYSDDCIGASSSNREELTKFIAAANSFHLALKSTWKISVHSLSL